MRIHLAETAMAETFDPTMLSLDKKARYAELEAEAAAVVEGETNLVARMATICSMLAHAFNDRIWTGFYIVDPHRAQELVVGPYQGTLGCLRIAFDRGVCGAAARTLQTQIVDDVHAFAGHIACDARTKSEIVVPVVDGEGRLLAVLDIDSGEPSTFDAVDAAALESLVKVIFGGPSTVRSANEAA